jgi:hypothetical protein
MRATRNTRFVFLLLMVVLCMAPSGDLNYLKIPVKVDFGDKLQIWDGFGLNYVETSQTFDYEKHHQDYGGFSILDPEDREEIIGLFFGDGGLKPAIVKMFLDPLHQEEPGGEYNHARTTSGMRHFVKEGLKLTRLRGEDLSVITTLYSPPAYITEQNILRGRDINPEHVGNMTGYMISWVDYLVNDQEIPVRYLSIHNEGESWQRWPPDGTLGHAEQAGHDYNYFCTPELMNDLIKGLRTGLDTKGLASVGVTNGEPTNWYRFGSWGYADALVSDPEALEGLGLITSHGFYVGNIQSGRWFGPHSRNGAERVLRHKPGLHVWTTSSAWDLKYDRCPADGSPSYREYIMNAAFIKEIHGNIYEAGVNAYIPWACMQRESHWNKPDPNPGTAIRVHDDGTWEINKGYYYYKNVTLAGRPGMAVAYTHAMDSEIAVIAFASNGTGNPDAFVVINYGDLEKTLNIEVMDSDHTGFSTRVTAGSQSYMIDRGLQEMTHPGFNHVQAGDYTATNGLIEYKAPGNSVTTFTGY